jgi:hypothetical protein
VTGNCHAIIRKLPESIFITLREPESPYCRYC